MNPFDWLTRRLNMRRLQSTCHLKHAIPHTVPDILSDSSSGGREVKAVTGASVKGRRPDG